MCFCKVKVEISSCNYVICCKLKNGISEFGMLLAMWRWASKRCAMIFAASKLQFFVKNISLCCLPCAWKWNSHKFPRVFDMWRWKAQLFAMFVQYESWNLDFSLVSEDENLNISLSKTESLCYLQHATYWDAQLFAMLFAMWNENLSFSLCDLGTQDENFNISLCCLQCALIWILKISLWYLVCDSTVFFAVLFAAWKLEPWLFACYLFVVWTWECQHVAMRFAFRNWNSHISAMLFPMWQFEIDPFSMLCLIGKWEAQCLAMLSAN